MIKKAKPTLPAPSLLFMLVAAAFIFLFSELEVPLYVSMIAVAAMAISYHLGWFAHHAINNE